MSDFHRCLALASLTGALCAHASAAPQSGTTTRVNVSSSGQVSDRASGFPVISRDGRFVAFHSQGTELVPGDTNFAVDVFVHDRATGQTERVSVDSSGAEVDMGGHSPSLSGDGRYVAFLSLSDDLVAGDTNGVSDVFVHDRETGVTRRASVGSNGEQADFESLRPALARGGRFVAFDSRAETLVPGDTNDTWDVFVHDLATGETVRASRSSGGVQGNDPSTAAALSSDGRFVAFQSYASNLVDLDTNGEQDTFVHDLLRGRTQRVSVDSSGNQADGGSFDPVDLSGDGQRVAFVSWATNLVPGDTNAWPDVFVHDLASGATTRVSTDSAGGQAELMSHEPSISADGRTVSFLSFSSSLVPGDANGFPDVFLKDLVTGTTTLESLSSTQEQAQQTSHRPRLSADGAFVVFGSPSENLVPVDQNGEPDVFVRDRSGCSSTVATYCTASATSIPGCQATLTAGGTPSLASPGAFQISTGDIPGGNLGILYYRFQGPAAIPIGTLGGLICVDSTPFRSAPRPTGGSAGTCDGELTFDLQDVLASFPGTLEPSTTVHAAVWFRDPANPDGYALSDGVWFDVCP